MINALVVDDKVENLYLLEVVLKGHGYGVQTASNGLEGLTLARHSMPGIIIADILMPVMDGFSFCRECKQDPILKHVPFVFFTATYTDSRDEQFAKDLGADLFIVKPMEPDLFMEKIESVMDKYAKGTLKASQPLKVNEAVYLKEYNETLIRKLEDKMTDLEKVNQALSKSEEALIRAYESTLESWSRALDMRDPATNGHTERTIMLTLRLARVMNLTDDAITQIRRGALLHDIGKILIPDSILLKPGALDEKEWELMRKHPIYAYEILSPIDFLKPALDIPYFHHEKWDGTGYPLGLKGEEIPLAARLFAIVDVWDALRSERSYRPAWPKEKVLSYLNEQRGRHFDPQVLALFMKLMSDVENY